MSQPEIQGLLEPGRQGRLWGAQVIRGSRLGWGLTVKIKVVENPGKGWLATLFSTAGPPAGGCCDKSWWRCCAPGAALSGDSQKSKLLLKVEVSALAKEWIRLPEACVSLNHTVQPHLCPALSELVWGHVSPR